MNFDLVMMVFQLIYVVLLPRLDWSAPASLRPVCLRAQFWQKDIKLDVLSMQDKRLEETVKYIEGK